MRLIDAEETIKAIEEVRKIMGEEIVENDRKDLINFVNGLNQACLCVEQQPTVEERQKGEWIECKSRYDKRDHFYKCSECGRFINLICGAELEDHPYCHCGAEMKGEE